MTLKVAINGFGRIGRLVMRAITESTDADIQVVAINDLASPKTNAHLFKYDSTHGRYGRDITLNDDIMDVGFGPIKMTSERDPENLPWGALDVDIAFECTGIFTKKAQAEKHLKAGAKRVLISAPSPDADITTVFGVNDAQISKDHLIVSNASCTTNCLAPVANVLHETVGIEVGFMTTVHAYTNDQNVLDQCHKDPYRGRAAAVNMIPTSTGAAKAVGLVLPELNGKLDGVAVRVPTPNVSMIDLTFTSVKETTIEEINNALETAAQGPLKNVLYTTDEPLVSGDLNHFPASSTVALDQTKVMSGNFVRVMSWYDNEWGFSNRMLDTAKVIGKFL